jgi:hypothetical protein
LKFKNRNEKEREAHADMCTSNVLNIYKKTCISIDTAGGRNIESWKISVYALAKRPRELRNDGLMHHWETSRMYCSYGITGIVHAAAGLLAAVEHYPAQLSDFGNLLGSGVGLHVASQKKII